MATGFYWIIPPRGIIDNIIHMREKTVATANKRFADFAEEVESWMKANHPWNNRTTTAEQSLEAEITGSGDVMIMEIGYNMGIMMSHPDGRQRDYSVYLEGYLGLGIIQPTMAIKAPEAMGRFSGIMTL